MDASFATTAPKLVESLGKLVIHENRTHFPSPFTWEDSEHAIPTMEGNREKFLVNLQLALIALMTDREAHHMWSNERLNTNRRSPFA